MPLFSRKAADGTAPGRDKHHTSPFVNRHVNTRPTFGEWVKYTWLDIVTMACLGAVGLGVYMAPPAPTRSFPVTYQDGEVVYPQFAYQMRKNIIPIWLAAFLASVIPIVIFCLMQIRVRSFWDLNNAILGLLYSLINAAVFQVFIKWLIGGLRPHFLAVCKPALPVSNAAGAGYLQIMYNRSICTGDRKEINDSLESMPSGHSTAAFAGFIFLYLYLNGKLKVFSNYHPSMWKITALYMPVLGAVLIAGSLTIDEYHHWYDVVAGGIIGTVFAFSSYRAVYAAIWDFRFNHVPLPRGGRTMGYTYSANSDDGFWSTVATRKAGWGWAPGASAGGAPGDASGLPPGVGANSSGGHRHGHHRNGVSGARDSGHIV